MTQAKPGADMNLGEYPSIPEVSCPTAFPFPVFLDPNSHLRFFPIRAFSSSRLAPPFFPTHASLFPDSCLPFPDSRRFSPTHASLFPDSRLPFFPDSCLPFSPTHTFPFS